VSRVVATAPFPGTPLRPDGAVAKAYLWSTDVRAILNNRKMLLKRASRLAARLEELSAENERLRAELANATTEGP
jgi:hypothetical protein